MANHRVWNSTMGLWLKRHVDQWDEREGEPIAVYISDAWDVETESGFILFWKHGSLFAPLLFSVPVS